LWFEASLGKQFHETLSQKKPVLKKGLVEWLKVEALSSNTSTDQKKKRHYNNKKNEVEQLIQ
jgi:hypothetical protein